MTDNSLMYRLTPVDVELILESSTTNGKTEGLANAMHPSDARSSDSYVIIPSRGLHGK